MSDATRTAIDEFKSAVLALATHTAGDAREKLVELANLSALVLADIAAGRYTPTEAEEAKANLLLAGQSALVDQAYTAQDRALSIASAGLMAGLKIALALA